jgi:hypothetical protein
MILPRGLPAGRLHLATPTRCHSVSLLSESAGDCRCPIVPIQRSASPAARGCSAHACSPCPSHSPRTRRIPRVLRTFRKARQPRCTGMRLLLQQHKRLQSQVPRDGRLARTRRARTQGARTRPARQIRPLSGPPGRLPSCRIVSTGQTPYCITGCTAATAAGPTR